MQIGTNLYILICNFYPFLSIVTFFPLFLRIPAFGNFQVGWGRRYLASWFSSRVIHFLLSPVYLDCPPFTLFNSGSPDSKSCATNVHLFLKPRTFFTHFFSRARYLFLVEDGRSEDFVNFRFVFLSHLQTPIHDNH